MPASRWATGVDDGVGAGESLGEPAAAGVPLEEEDDEEEEEPDRFGVFTSRLVPDGRVTDGVGTVTEGVLGGVVTDGVVTDGVVTDGVLTIGGEIFGVVAVGVITEGVLTVGAGPTGVVTCGVVTDGTVTDGTVTDGTVAWGVVTAGGLAAGALTVGSPTLGSVAAVPASGWLISRARPAATVAKEQILRMSLERSGVMKLAHSGTNCRGEGAVITVGATKLSLDQRMRPSHKNESLPDGDPPGERIVVRAQTAMVDASDGIDPRRVHRGPCAGLGGR